MTIFVSAGHGPVDPGVVYLGFQEHLEAKVWRDLIIQGVEALGTPAESVPEVELLKKIAFINERCAQIGKSLAIEMHFNAGGTPGQTRGCETLFAPGSAKGELLARVVQDGLDSFFPPDRGIKEAWYRQDHPHRVDFPGDIDGDEKPDAFCVRTVCPAIICEPEFIYERASIQGKREAACRSIAAALVNAYALLCR